MRLQSRKGSIVLAIAGVVYVIASVSLLGWSVSKIGEYAGIRDYAVYGALVVACAVGVWFLTIALESLDIDVRHWSYLRRAHLGDHSTALR